MDKRIETIKIMYDASAKNTENRVKASHFTENGIPLEESAFDDIFYHIDLNLGFSSNDVVLDVGAGTGLLLERIAEKVYKAYGTDISLEMLKKVTKKSNITVLIMDSDNLSFSDNAFDKVVCNSVILHFPDMSYAKKCFAEMHRVCKPGGKIFLGDMMNKYLEKLFFKEMSLLDKKHKKNVSLTKRMKAILKKIFWRQNSKTIQYLFIDPYDMYKWTNELGCKDFKVLIQLSRKKPLLHRMFRYDVIVIK